MTDRQGYANGLSLFIFIVSITIKYVSNMSKKLTTEDFIERANKVHNGKYDYSKTIYVKSSEKISIICPIHGVFWQTPNCHIKGQGCPKCGNERKKDSRKMSTEKFVEKAKIKHLDNYDYSKVEYTNCTTPVCIICPIHGEFWQKPYIHLSGNGCQKCGLIHRDIVRKITRRKIKNYGVGINDVMEKVDGTEYHNKWLLMLYRCYHPTQAKHSKSYKDVFVCDEWLRLSNFKEWFENPENGYKEGYQLDKDLLVKGNRIYSPDTCCFVPSEINSIIKLGNNRGKYPIGVIKIKQRSTKPYRADIKNRTIGYYATPEEAFFAYKKEKEKDIKDVATKYFNENKITKKVYEALMNFNIEIND